MVESLNPPRKRQSFFGLEDAEEHLRKRGVESPRLEAQLLLSHVLGITRERLLAADHLNLDDSQGEQFADLLARKIDGEPTAYILGKQEFFSLEFVVNPDVLIPRPETEELLEWVIATEERGVGSVLDLGTGSGCIGVVLARELEPERLVMSDQSGAALLLAQENFSKHCRLQVQFIQSDLFAEFEPDDQFDLIVSNPPYVLPEEYDKLANSITAFEPRQALLVAKPAEFFEAIASGAAAHLRAAGALYLELSPSTIEPVEQLLLKNGFSNAVVKKDLSGKERFIRATK